MNFKNLSIALIAVCALSVSCSKDKETDKLSGDEIVVANPKTAEDHKQNLEQTGLTVADELNGIQSVTGTAVMVHFAELYTSSSSDMMSKKSLVGAPINFSKKVNANYSLQELLSTLDTLITTDEAIREAWNSNAGTFIYNANANAFVKVEGLNTRNVSYVFPSRGDAKTNNAKLIIYEPSWFTGKLNGAATASIAPTFLSAELTVDGQTVMKYDYALTVDKTTGMATHLLSSISIDGYSFSFNADTKDNKTAWEKYTVAHNSKTLVELYAAITGDWSTALNANEVVPADMIETGEVSYQILNVKLVGKVNVKGLNTEMTAYDAANKTDSTQFNSILNKNLTFTLNYVSNNSLIANVLFSYSENNDNPFSNAVLQFSDGSKVDPNVYFSSVWDGMLPKLKEKFPDLFPTTETPVVTTQKR